MKLLHLATAFAAQTPLLDVPYKIAAERLGGQVDNQLVANAWNALYDADPEKFEKLSSGLPLKDNVIAFNERSDLTNVKIEAHPDHQIRYRDPSKLGVDNVKQRSGYLDILEEDKHFFFWMFESRNDPKNDPIVLWINGGPGCSSATGLFFELGPSKIKKDLSLESNPHAWNNNATIIFLDQPVNVGFSYSKKRVKTSTAGAKDVYAFLELFFHEFPEYSHLPFHISGESYAGHYLPAIGYEIIQHEDRPFNFTSVLIGNGITDLTNQADAQISMACGMGGYPAVLNETTCEKLYGGLPACTKLSKICDEDQSQLFCTIANAVCSSFKDPYYQTGRNSYDIRDQCYDHCYEEQNYIDEYLNQDHVKHEIGAEPIEFTGCSGSVYEDFILAGDRGFSMKSQVAALLEADVPVLIYLGDKDYNCNWLGNQQWTNNLEWYGHAEFASKPLHPWYFEGKIAGQTKNVDGFTFLRIYDAGHMVPYNKPRESLAMFNQWLAGDYDYAPVLES